MASCKAGVIAPASCYFTMHGGLIISFIFITAVPLSILTSLELSIAQNPTTVQYRSHGWLRECTKWDPIHHRFLVSTMFDAGIAAVYIGKVEMEEKLMLREADMAGNASLGITVDRDRRRLVVVFADVIGHKHSAVAAYDLDTWERKYLTRLSGPEDDQRSMADDVAVDSDGNAYVTDTKSNQIWKVDSKGQLQSTIRNQGFKQSKGFFSNLIGLNGIVYHPNGYLLVIHTFGGHLFRVDVATEAVTVVEILDGSSLKMGDGLELLSPNELVVVAATSVKVVESPDGWKTARVTRMYGSGPVHRVATAGTVKDGKVYVSHIVGGGFRRWTHVITEAVFSPFLNNVKDMV